MKKICTSQSDVEKEKRQKQNKENMKKIYASQSDVKKKTEGRLRKKKICISLVI